MENQSNHYVQHAFQTEDEKLAMYMKLSKKELVSMLLENQRLLNAIIGSQVTPSYPFSYPGTWEPIIWHGVNHPSTSEPLSPTYFTTSGCLPKN